jgi:LmbE family N-acetylglucosaminyl deacetylase
MNRFFSTGPAKVKEPVTKKRPWLSRVSALLIVGLAAPSLPALGGGAEPENGFSVADAVEAIQRARNPARILYVIAHPDDEGGSVGLLTYLARHLGAEVALLSITRGEGGQNAIGPEHGARLAVLRTAELESAARFYGTRLYFTRAADFGFSKSAEETLRIWGEQVVEEMKQVFRAFRPHYVINNWAGVRTGHGHHVAAGLLVPRVLEALRREDDPFWERTVLLDVARGGAEGVRIPSDLISPLRGRSYNEIGLDGFVQHRTQGIVGFRGAPFFRGTRLLIPEPGRTLTAAAFSLSLADLGAGLPFLTAGLQELDRALESAQTAALRLDWTTATRHLAAAGRVCEDLTRQLDGQRDASNWVAQDELDRVKAKIQQALVRAVALRLYATADRSELVAGETFHVDLSWQHRALAGSVREATLLLPVGWQITAQETQGSTVRFTVVVPEGTRPPEQPDTWMHPWPEPLVKARVAMEAEGYEFAAEVPVVHIRLSSTRAEEIPLRLVPAVVLSLEPRQFVVPKAEPAARLQILARIRQYATTPAETVVTLEGPAGWKVSAPVRLRLEGPGDQLVRFTVVPPSQLAPGNYTLQAAAERAGQRFDSALEPLPSLPTYLWSEPSRVSVRVLDLSIPAGLRIGYIAAANDPLPEALRQLGMEVTLLDEVALAFGDLSRFDAISVGIRAYELRPDLARANERLLEYVRTGGTLVVQYQRDATWNQLHPAPYPAEVGSSEGNVRARVTDENSPVRILLPDHPVLTFPNRISASDFDGWVQERGLYFWGRFDARYEAPLALHDPGEAETTGSLVCGRYGQGMYIYTGLAFFRQLPEGVPGAWRLFVNLLSQSRRPAS